MASYLAQGGTSLYHVSQAGVAVPFTLPAGITLFGSSQICRPVLFQVIDKPLIIVVNGGTHDFYIDQTGTARQLQLAAPTGTPVLTAGASTGLTGIYQVAVTFKVKDTNGATIIESGMGPSSVASASLVNQSLRLDNIPTSGDGTVNARGIYRTLSGGTTLYPWFDIDDNTSLFDDRATVDSLLSIIQTTATRLGAPPDLKLVASWRERLWGVPRQQVDHVRWTDERVFYGWSADNELLAPPVGNDISGVTALIPRRDNLGICKKRQLYMVTGNSNDSFQRVGISETLGCMSQESVVVINNVAYMLGERGVNEWSDYYGVRSVSDAQVQNWFNTDTYFNRSQFTKAQGRFNQDTNSYELLLCSAGSTNLDRWVAFQLDTRTWFGPHKTDAFTPTSAGTNSTRRGLLLDSNDLPITAFGGSDGFIYKRDQSVVTDNGIHVSLDINLPFLSAQEPDFDKYFDQPTIHTRADSDKKLVIVPTVGNLNSAAGVPLYHDLTLDREKLGRLGQGRYCQLNLKTYTDYDLEIFKRNPLAYWKLWHSTGEDLGPSNYSLTTNGVTATDFLTYGITGPLSDGSTSVIFTVQSATGPWLDAGNQTGLNMSGPFTLLAWGKTVKTGVPCFVSKFDGTHGYFLVLNSGNLRFGYVNASATTIFDFNSPLTYLDDVYHMFAGVYDGNRASLWVDGVQVANVPATGTLNATTGNVNIGRTSDGNNYYVGSIGDVSIFNTALGQSDFTAIYGTKTVLVGTERPRIFGIEIPYVFVGRR